VEFCTWQVKCDGLCSRLKSDGVVSTVDAHCAKLNILPAKNHSLHYNDIYMI